MADFSASTWTASDDANTAAPPNGLPSGTLPSKLAPTWRALAGASKRSWERANGQGVCTNSANAYTLTYSVSPTAYVKGEIYTFFPSATSTGSMTLTVNALGAKTVLQADGSPSVTGDFILNAPTMVAYDGTNMRLVTSAENPNFTAVTATTINATTALTVAGAPVWTSANFTPANYFTVASFNTYAAGVVAAFTTKQDALGYTPLNKAGDTMNGAFKVQMAAPIIRMGNTSNGQTRSYYHDGTNIGALDSADNWLWRADDSGALWTKQLGDINTRIENRASAYASATGNNCVQSSQMAGFVSLTMSNGATAEWGAYVITRATRVSGDQYAFGARQPQLYIPNRGWFAAFAF